VPNPAAAAVLGLIPGVGAMYNGQLFKGLIHVVIFAVLISITDHVGIFGIFVAGWVLYQSFEAYHTAKARRDGTPIPDPFGLNEVGNWLNLSGVGLNPRGTHPPNQPGVPPGVPPAGYQPGYQSGYQPGYQSGSGIPPQPPPPGWAAGAAQPGPSPSNPAQPGYSASASTEPPPYNAPYSSTWTGTEPGYQAAYTDPNAPFGSYAPGSIPPIPPPIPPIPPYNWRRREPVWAIVLIILGVIFLLHSMGIITHLFFHYAWPILLIGVGVWLIVRRLGYTMGGSK
jgi:hypothetical protein